MSVYAQHFSTKKTPQSEPIHGKKQVKNSAGGFVFAIDDWKRLDRFLVLGNEGGTYYASEKNLTKENAKCVLRCADENPSRTVARIVEISESGRAPKNDPAIFALAMLAAHDKAKNDALLALPLVCRIGTHLFQFAEAVQNFRGWGRGLRTAIAAWYANKTQTGQLPYQLVKYQQRNGWSHRDLLRLCHIDHNADNGDLRWAVGASTGDRIVKRLRVLPNGKKELLREDIYNETAGVSDIIAAFEDLKNNPNKNIACNLIQTYNLPREAIPTQLLNSPEVWESLLDKIPMHAMVRNLATMTRVGLLQPFSDSLAKVMTELGDADRIKKSRLHPVAILAALLTYKAGRGVRGHNTWVPVTQVVDALDAAFYTAFENVVPTGKRWFIGCDVSGSMWGGTIAGVPGLSPGLGAAAMALITARTEKTWYLGAFNTEMVPFSVSPRERLDAVAEKMQRLPWGGTDCSKPMLHALEHKWPVDVFYILTDNETWAGAIHPSQALVHYRQKMGIDAKLVVCGMTATEFSIADRDDAGMMDVVGFDTATPQLVADFARDDSVETTTRLDD